MREETDRLDNVAKHYDPYQSFDYCLIQFDAEEICPRVEGKSALELGCATGVMSARLAQAAAKLTIVDGAAEYVDQTRAVIEKTEGTTAEVTYVASLFEDFEPDCKFDAVILANILEHIENPTDLLKRAAAWLKPGGELHIVVPNAQSLHRRIGHAMGMLEHPGAMTENDHKLGHRRVYEFDTLRDDIQCANLQIIHETGIFLKPLSNAQMESYGKQLTDALYKVGQDLPEWCAEIYFIARPRA